MARRLTPPQLAALRLVVDPGMSRSTAAGKGAKFYVDAGVLVGSRLVSRGTMHALYRKALIRHDPADDTGHGYHAVLITKAGRSELRWADKEEQA